MLSMTSWIWSVICGFILPYKFHDFTSPANPGFNVPDLLRFHACSKSRYGHTVYIFSPVARETNDQIPPTT